MQAEGSSGLLGRIAQAAATLSAAPRSQAHTSDHQVIPWSLHLHYPCITPSLPWRYPSSNPAPLHALQNKCSSQTQGQHQS